MLTWDADANPDELGTRGVRQSGPDRWHRSGFGRRVGRTDGWQGQSGDRHRLGDLAEPKRLDESDARALAERYPEITLLETLVSDEDQAKAGQLCRDVLASQPDLAGIWAITSMALPAAAKAVRDSGRSGKVAVTGLSVPSTMREFVKDGTVARFVLWNPVDLGYLTVQVAKRAAEEKLAPGEHTFGRLAGVRVAEGDVLLGPPVIFDNSNIDQFEF